jgi:hypothetical protein
VTEHTPGPWRVERWDDSKEEHWGWWVLTGPALLWDGEFQEPDRNPEVEANARLIAAAPRMLKALKRADPFLFNAPLEGALDAWDEVRATITEAEGES